MNIIVQIARPFNLPAVALFDYEGAWKARREQREFMPVEDVATEKRKLGERICQMRTVRATSLLDLEMEAGIPRKTTKEIENGTINTDFRMLVRLANFFEVEFFELFNYEQP